MLSLAPLAGLQAQTGPFTGTNEPGAASDFFPITVTDGMEGITLEINNTLGAYSNQLLRRNDPPTDDEFDFAGIQSTPWQPAVGNTANIYLERPELQSGDYGLRVQTTSSGPHNFVSTLTINPTGLRSATKPVTKPLVSDTTGTLAPNTWHYFRVQVPSDSRGWKLVLNSVGAGNADLYVKKDSIPTVSSSTKSSKDLAVDTLVFTDFEIQPGGIYYIGVNLPATAAGASNYTLHTEEGVLTELAWDSGTSHPGTQVHTNTSPTGGDYYFLIRTQNSNVGAWRTALNVSLGEAAIYLRKASTSGAPILPTPGNSFRFSAVAGSDGFVLNPTEFAANEDWIILVKATPGAEWNLVTGEAHVQDLGILRADGSSGSGSVAIGAEGTRFFKTEVPANTLGWRLYRDDLPADVLIKEGVVPFASAGKHDYKRVQQMLVVPPLLKSSSTVYYIAVPGVRGSTVSLDSGVQEITDLGFQAQTTLDVTGYGYKTYRVQVPPDQIGWEVSVTPITGNPDVSVQEGNIPTDDYNGAFSEVGGVTVDSIALSPPVLRNGTYYITVYNARNQSPAAYSCTLRSRTPEVTPTAYVSQNTNADLNRVGWRYYSVANIAEQLGTLGWTLFLQNQPPGTEIYIRKNFLPSRRNYRVAGTLQSDAADKAFDVKSALTFLQHPNHQSDVWYIGIYNPTLPAGAFVLTTSQILAPSVSFNGGVSSHRDDVASGKWEFFRVDVPADAKGWDLHLQNVTSGLPRMVIRRDRLPETTASAGVSLADSTWDGTPASDALLVADDYTDWLSSSTGASEAGRHFTAGVGRPLVAGATYYVGVVDDLAGGKVPMTYDIESSGIGSNYAIQIAPIAFAGGSGVVTNLAPRRVQFFRVDVPPNTPSWEVKLTSQSGESMVSILKDFLPNTASTEGQDATTGTGIKMLQPGNEHYYMFPTTGQEFITPGTYFLAVVSEGVGAGGGRIGTSVSSALLESKGVFQTIPLGTLNTVEIIRSDSLEPGEIKAYTVDVAVVSLGIDVRMDPQSGDPYLTYRRDELLSAPPKSSFAYGYDGGRLSPPEAGYGILISDPTMGVSTVMVRANSKIPATYTLHIEPENAVPVPFDQGSQSVNSQPLDELRFFAVVVPEGAVGWDLRLTNVIGGDPIFAVGRDYPPANLGDNLIQYTDSTWPTRRQLVPQVDLTGAALSEDGVNVSGRRMVVGMGRPLEPGTYYITVMPRSFSGPMSFTLESRGIGAGLSIPIRDLDYAGGTDVINALIPREAKYYRIAIPDNSPSWHFTLQSDVEGGETVAAVLRDFLPNRAASESAEAIASGVAGVRLRKVGPERYWMFPPNGQSSIASGIYYISVVSEGVNPTGGKVGTGSSNATLTSHGPIPINALGTVGPVDLVAVDTLEPAGLRAYQFSVPPDTDSVEVRLESITGEPKATLTAGSLHSMPGGSGTYGLDGGQTPLKELDKTPANITYTLVRPTAGTYSITVKPDKVAGNFASAGYTLRIIGQVVSPLNFDNPVAGGSRSSIAGHSPQTWRYFRIEVPADTLGWDLRLTNVSSGDPEIVVRRDEFPTSLATSGVTLTGTTWPTGKSYKPLLDWTGLKLSATGSDETGRLLMVSMGRPLEAGTYIVGVRNGDPLSGTMSYTIQSRGIGTGYSIPVTNLNGFTANTVLFADLPGREAAYFRIVIPAQTPSLVLKLAPSSGESMLAVLRSVLPNIGCSLAGDSTLAASAGIKMMKAGDEYYHLLPANGQNFITAGIYCLAVVSQGVNPTIDSIGSSSAAGSLTLQSPLVASQIGVLGTVPTIVADTLAGGQMKAYQFTLPNSASIFEVRLENQTGTPTVALVPGVRLPTFPAASAYGIDGGQTAGLRSTSTIMTWANAAPGVYSVAAGSSALLPSGYTVKFRTREFSLLNVAAFLNGNGSSHIDTRTLIKDEQAFYKVEIPEVLDGSSILAWRLSIGHGSGDVTLRISQTLAGIETGLVVTGDSAVLVPPFLKPGSWYLRVDGVTAGSSQYSITSEVTRDTIRPAWLMPASGQVSQTPGLVSETSLFGDTGIEPNGTPLPGDQGTDLALDQWHYYSVIVPEGNAGLLRTSLEALNGNPNVYLRNGAFPTITHDLSGRAGTLADRRLTGLGTEYGNWVPLDGKVSTVLPPGMWFVAVHAGGNSNVRYRLRASLGEIRDLALTGGVTNQTVAKGDWIYYRVQIPLQAPSQWKVTFSEQFGDVSMYVRDTCPPGLKGSVTEADTADWVDDNKNAGPYAKYDAPSTYTFNSPPVRPGSVYYIGVLGRNDATYSVSSNVVGDIGDIPAVDFYTGRIDVQIPANSSKKFRIDVPVDGGRWKHTATHPGSVQVRIEQGALPTGTGDDYSSGVAQNSVLNQIIGTTWPWVRNQHYFMQVTNTSASEQRFVLVMNGRSLLTDDDDNDLLPDVWERDEIGGLSQNATSDGDKDGIQNLVELGLGLDPLVPDIHLMPRVSVENNYLTLTVDKPQFGSALFTYTVEKSASMLPGSWAPALDIIENTPTRLKVRDSVSVTESERRYLRLKMVR